MYNKTTTMRKGKKTAENRHHLYKDWWKRRHQDGQSTCIYYTHTHTYEQIQYIYMKMSTFAHVFVWLRTKIRKVERKKKQQQQQNRLQKDAK